MAEIFGPGQSAAAETKSDNEGRVGGDTKLCLGTAVDKSHGAKTEEENEEEMKESCAMLGPADVRQ